MQQEKTASAEFAIDGEPVHPATGSAQRDALKRHAATNDLSAYQPGEYKVIRRNGKVTSFDATKINVAVTKSFIDVEGRTAAASTRVHEKVRALTEQVVEALTRRMPSGGTVHIEDIQDQVELALMRDGEQKVARAYVIYREERARERDKKNKQQKPGKTAAADALRVKTRQGELKKLDQARLVALCRRPAPTWSMLNPVSS